MAPTKVTNAANATEEPPLTSISKLARQASDIGKAAVSSFLDSSQRTEEDTLFSTLEDFSRAGSGRRLVVIGGTGSGKSTLLNLFAGYRFVQSEDYQFKWKDKNGKAVEKDDDLLFVSKQQVQSTTKHSSFANVRWRGNADVEPIVVVDTPGYDDTSGYDVTSPDAQKHLGIQAADLHNKLKVLGEVHTLLIVHNDVSSNKINPATFEILKMVDEKFAAAGRSVWENVVIGYSKCNAFETTWRCGLKAKKADLQKLLKDKFARCKCNVPVLALGGGESLARTAIVDKEEKDGFDELTDFISKADPLDTSNLLPFDGVAEQFRQAVEARDAAEAKAKAILIYGYVMCKLLLLFFGLSFRSSFSATVSRTLMFNPETLLDEVAILGLFVYWIGPMDCWNSVKVAYEQHVAPKLAGVQMNKAKAE